MNAGGDIRLETALLLVEIVVLPFDQFSSESFDLLPVCFKQKR